MANICKNRTVFIVKVVVRERNVFGKSEHQLPISTPFNSVCYKHLLREREFEVVNWIHLAHDTKQYRAVLHNLMLPAV